MARIGCLGLGKMGSGIASHLVAAGHDVTVWNRSPEKVEALTAKGAAAAATPADAAHGADAMISMVADDAASARVWSAGDGALAAARPGALVIECSTISHGHVMSLAAEAKDRGLTYIDSPVNGPPKAAAEGKLILLVGAAPHDLEKARPILETIGSSILHFGAVGTGTAFKLINNLLGAVHIASLAEAVSLANKLGLDQETLIAAIESGPCASPHVTRLARPMVEDNLSPTPALSIGLREKDARYCLGLASDAAMGMSVGEVAHRWYQLAAASLAEIDDSALIQTVAAHAGSVPGVDG